MSALSPAKELQKTLAFARSQGAKHIALCYYDRLPVFVTLLLRLGNLGVPPHRLNDQKTKEKL